MNDNLPLLQYLAGMSGTIPTTTTNLAQLLAPNLEKSQDFLLGGPYGLHNGTFSPSTQGLLNHPATAQIIARLNVMSAFATNTNIPKETRLLQNVGILLPPLNQFQSAGTSENNADEKTGKALADKTGLADSDGVNSLQPHSKKISKKSLEDKSSSSKGRRTWQKWEDDQIMELIQEHGKNWTLISKLAGGTRTGKQIRDRYLNKLNPSIAKTEWTKEEDEQLLKFFKEYGRKWTLIAKHLSGRTESSVKNRFMAKFATLSSNRQEDTYLQSTLDAQENSCEHSFVEKSEGRLSQESPEFNTSSTHSRIIKVEMEEKYVQTKIEEAISSNSHLNIDSEINCKTESESEQYDDLRYLAVLNELKEKVKVLEDVIQSKCTTFSWIEAIQEVAYKAPGNAEALERESSKITKEVNSRILDFKASFRSASQDINKILDKLPDN